MSGGYSLGKSLSRKPTVLKGKFIDFRKIKTSPLLYIQTDVNLVEGMRWGLLVDQCGKGDISLFIEGNDIKAFLPNLSDQQIKKIQVNPTKFYLKKRLNFLHLY